MRIRRGGKGETCQPDVVTLADDDDSYFRVDLELLASL